MSISILNNLNIFNLEITPTKLFVVLFKVTTCSPKQCQESLYRAYQRIHK